MTGRGVPISLEAMVQSGVPLRCGFFPEGQEKGMGGMAHAVKVLGIFGSPRRGGNTELLLAEALRGAAGEGAEVEQVRLCDREIHPCRGCQACFRDGTCIVDDDMQALYPTLAAAAVIIIASPIYFYGITAQAKAMVDRCQALWARRYILHLSAPEGERRPRQGFFIAASGTRGRRVFEGASLTVRYFLDACGAEYTGDLLFPGVDARGDIGKEPDALPQAFAAGRRLAAEPWPGRPR